MKLTKTVTAVAVAGLFAVPMAASAETTLSGVVQVQFQGFDDDDAEAGEGDFELGAGDVRVAINTQHGVGGGLTGYANLQMNLDDLTGEGGLNQDIQLGEEVDPDDPDFDPENPFSEDATNLNSAATVSSDNVYVGLKGGFGDIRIGEIPLAVEYGQKANDIHDVGATVIDGISYVGTFGPVGVIGNFSLEDDSDMFGIGANFSLAGFGIGLGFESRDSAEGSADNFAAGASFGIAGFSVAVQYWLKGQADESADSDTDEENVAIKVGYSIAGVGLGLTYSLLNNQGFVADVEESQIRFDASYDLGGGFDVSTRINFLDRAGNADGQEDFDAGRTDYRIQISKSF